MCFFFSGPLFSSFRGHFFVHFWITKVASPSLYWSKKKLVGATKFSVFGVTFLAAKSHNSIVQTILSRIRNSDHLNFRTPLTAISAQLERAAAISYYVPHH
jgi:hypothetical protein